MSLSKKILFIALANLLGLGAVELVARGLLALIGAAGASGSALTAEQRREADRLFPALLVNDLAPAVRYNMRDNVLTVPDPDLLFRVKPNARPGEFHGYQGINAQGFRGRPLPDTPGAAAKNAVLIVGDSCAFGWRIPAYDQTIQGRLEAMLAGRNARPVYNLAQPGYSSHQARLLFDRHFDDVRPAHVVLYLGWNDIWRTSLLSDEATRRMIAWTSHPIARWLQSTGIALLARRLVELAPGGTGEVAPVVLEPGYPRRVEPEDTLANFAYMIERTRAAGATPIVILPPHHIWQVYELYAVMDDSRAIYERFKQQAVFLALPSLRTGGNTNHHFFFRDGYHPNPEGARVIARELFDVIDTAATPEDVGPLLVKQWTFHSVLMEPRGHLFAPDPTAAAHLGAARLVQAGQGSGWLITGPAILMRSGTYRAAFSLKVKDPVPVPVARLEVATGGGTRIHATRTLTGRDFARAGAWETFTLDFELEDPGVSDFETRVYFYGATDLYSDYIRVRPRS